MNSTRLPVVYVTDQLARASAAFLDSFARDRPAEGVVYWFGFDHGSSAIVTTLVVPDADTSGGTVRTSPQANARAISVALGTPLVYIGQVHSHPGPGIWHSPVDDAETFAQCNGVISVVVPWFGRYGFELEQCGVHRHISGRFRRIDRTEEHLRILPGVADLRNGGTASDERM